MNWEGKEILIRSILSLRDAEEARHFFSDILSEKELTEFYNRLRAAEMLMEEESYENIHEETGLSSATIARVGRWIKAGDSGGRKIIKRVHEKNAALTDSGISDA